MDKNYAEDSFILDNLTSKLCQTARVSELLGRNYYKKYIKDARGILELDEFIILSCIKKYPTISQSDIAKMVLKGKAHIGKILTEMEKKEYITRSVNINHNMMIKQTAMTEKGLELFIKTDKVLQELSQDTLKIFTQEEIDVFEKLLDKYKKSMLEKYEILF